MNKCFFITGTDTNIGKTIVSCALLQGANFMGYKAIGYKPIASGSKETKFGLRNQDSEYLLKYSTVHLEYQDINPFTFKEGTSPNIASKIEKKIIDINKISQGLEKIKKKADYIIIEGAGGWYTPISFNQTLSDWVTKEKIEIILVIGIKLGCINHAILTKKAILNEKLKIVGWIGNHLESTHQYTKEYLETINTFLSPIPCLGNIPFLKNWKKKSMIEYLYLNKIFSYI
ncbi:MAG: dethiobiotin synthase [Arsenophonus sp.]|nr:MAG: dethiobiotin synthase [Arsenophonus sp.]